MSRVASPKGESMTQQDGDVPEKRARRKAPTSGAAAEGGTVAVRFCMAAEHLEARDVHLVGEFNGWSRTQHPMTRSGNQFVAEVELATGRTYRYKFLIDGTRWENDWNADSYVANEFGGDDSVIDLRGSSRDLPVDPDAPGAGVDDVVGDVPEPNEPA
jgi:1,4-alpha-glucan branching enzyme